MTLRPVAATLLALAGVRDGETVVDVACGAGLMTHSAAAAAGPAGRVYGVDPDAGLLAAARASRSSAVVWIRAAADALPFRDGSVDKVVYAAWPHGLPGPAPAEWARVLAPGGRVAVAASGDAGALPVLLEGAGLRVTHDSAAEVDGMLIRYASATAP